MIPEFDTRDKKPKLYEFLILSIAAVLLSAVLVITDPEGSAGAVCVVISIYAFLSVVSLLYYFREQIKYNPYSYNTIFYFGFALFSLFVLIIYIILSVKVFRNPGLFSASTVIHTLIGSGGNYAFFTFPFILIFSLALCISNISLIRHEGASVVNFLGILLALLLVGVQIFVFIFDYSVSGSVTEVMIHDIITNFITAVYMYFECMIIGTIVADSIAARHVPKFDIDYMIILGCALRKDGSPTPLLRGRIDRALEFADMQKEATGKEFVFVASGGKGEDEIISEAGAIAAYLKDKGIPEDRIILEDKSTNTFENMKFSKEKIFSIDPDSRIAFSTTNYHVFRSGIFSRRVKMRSQGIGADTKWYFWPNAAVREFAGLVTKHKVKQLVILGVTILLYTVLTILAYRYY